MRAREGEVEVIVTGPPVGDTYFNGYGRAASRYLLTSVSVAYSFRNGNWNKPRWRGIGHIVKKDGSIGKSSSGTPWSFEPNAETQRQFIVTARKQIREAATRAMEVPL